MSTKQIQHWLDNHAAFRDRGTGFRVFTTAIFLFHLLAILLIGALHLFA